MNPKGPYLLGVYCDSLIDVSSFVNEWKLAAQVVQIIEARGFWVMLAVSGDQNNLLREYGARQRPRWSFL